MRLAENIGPTRGFMSLPRRSPISALAENLILLALQADTAGYHRSASSLIAAAHEMLDEHEKSTR